MPDSFSVFVCSTFDDLEQEREGVLDAIRRVQSRHNAMEFFGARPGRPIDICLDEVRKSDLLVVIVGLKYGSLPPGIGISYSQAEYEEGVRLKKPCLVYLRDDDVPILPKYVERDPDKLRLLETWKRALNAKHTVAKFENWPGLAVQVAADIGNFLLVVETSRDKGVPEAPLREVLKRLGETEVAEAEIPDRLAKAADELLRLRADLARLRNDRPEFAAIRARASALIDQGDFDGARAALREGRRRADELLEELSRTKAGFLADEARIDRLQLNYDSACAKFAEAARLDPDNVSLWIDLGGLWETRGLLAEAEKAFFAARDAAARIGNEYELAWSHSRIGDVEVQQGDLAGALASYRSGFAIIDPLTESDPSNANWQRELSVSYNKIGYVQAQQGDLARALTSYGVSLAIAKKLTQSDPSSAGWQRDLSVSHERVGDMQVAQRDRAEALKSYRVSLKIRKRLAKSDPGNAIRQYDLGLSNEKIGNVQIVQGDLIGAQASYRAKFAIIDSLARSDPGNALFQRDLSVAYEKIGNVQFAQQDFAEAFKSYRESFAIIERRMKSDPDNAEWQRHAAVSHGKIARALAEMGNRVEALEALQQAHAIMVLLTALSPDNAQWKRDLDVFASRIAEISQ
jgi:tetratricopeptide (TPR) repeat protein